MILVKKISMGIIVVFLLFVGINVNAEEYFYTNNNGLNFTEFQYETMVHILGAEMVSNLTQEDYDLYEVSNMQEETFKMATTVDEDVSDNSCPTPYGTYYETQSKQLVLTSSCTSSYCTIIITNTWKKNPAVRSYDMIGVRLSSTYFYDDTVTSTLRMNDTNYNRSGMMGASNGVGCAMKLRSTGDVDFIVLKVRVLPQGIVYGSYQHAVRSINLDTALNFNFDSNGYGGVFLYPSSIGTTFDQMAGVYIVL